MTPRLLLLGTPRVEEGAQPRTIPLNNPTSLLIHLAFRRDWVSRSELAFLYRPDENEVSALKHTRLLLYRAKKYSWAKTLEVDKKQVRFLIATDVHTFKEALSRQAWREASEVYRGPFLAGQGLASLPTYTTWLDIERADLDNSYRDALSKYAAALERQRNYEAASDVLKKLLTLDDLAEDALQAYLRTSYLAGHRDRALRAYRAFCQTLASEYNAEPQTATQHLARAIREHQPLEGAVLTSQGLAGSSRVLGKLPEQTTRFIGREKDLRGAAQRLHDDECRLLTLVGLGGAGKTRLAIELAQLEQGRFKDGVYFVPLAPLSSADAFATALAQALDLTLTPTPDPLAQVTDHLRTKELLLILDNFEHLLAAAPALSTLLAGAAKLKVLVTSRESLKLKAEWLYDVEGLEYPTINARDVTAYDAVQLFLSSAKRVAPKLALDADEVGAVAHICRQLEGLPLAVELAASWVRVMPVARIAQDLQQGYELLQTEQTDLPERHRNLKAILNTTWQRLSEQKRSALARFAIFKGGCTLEAAESVTETHVSILLSLVNESLLRRVLPGRFEMHELIKQHAYERLEAQPEDLQVVLTKHAAYYQKELIKTRLTPNETSKPKLSIVADDLENFTAAWHYLVQHKELTKLDRLNEPMYTYFFMSGRFKEGLELFSSSADRLKETSTPVLAKLRISEGRFWHRQGNLKKAKDALETALAMAKTHQDGSAGAAHSFLGDCLYESGAYAEAKCHYEAALRQFQRRSDWQGLARIYNMLGNLAKREGASDLARTHFTKSLAAFTETGDATGRTNALNNMANLAEAQGDYAVAKANYLDCLAIFENLNFVRGVAVVKNNLGVVELKLGHLDEAETLVRASLALKQVIADPISIVLSEVTLADVLLAKRDVAGAESCVLKAFTTALHKDFRRVISKSAPTLTKLCYHTGAHEAAEKLMDALMKQSMHSADLEKELAPLRKAPPSQIDTSFELVRIAEQVTAIMSREDAPV